MKNPNFTYQIKQQKLWFNNSEITRKKVNHSGSCIFFLEETNPSHWITLKLAKAGQALKAFYKQIQPDCSPQYFRAYFPLSELTKPFSFQFTPTEEVEKKADGKWEKVIA